MRSDFLDEWTAFEPIHYRTKEYIGRVCRDIIEDILKQTYDEENPVASAPLKCTRANLREVHPTQLKTMVEINRAKPKISPGTDDIIPEDLIVEESQLDPDINSYEVIDIELESLSDATDEQIEELKVEKLEDILDNMSTTIDLTVVDLSKINFNNSGALMRCNCNNDVVDMEELAKNMVKLLLIGDRLMRLLRAAFLVLCINIAFLLKDRLLSFFNYVVIPGN
ncbi:hypothetical protein GWI33_015852 [Rhynchophorus ferrugineus]|uniref:Uncharacterized protein n=1 Tax=Rhynchophorus ferrugineus TaxID=354439 RepID=A0A834I2P7_RHYFE|nr:hypothetical protein GWI33_015852 [Rhynchophorus ferrugineus]